VYHDTCILIRIHRILDSDQNARIMVHCFLGVSRSATVILAYWIKYGPIFVDLNQAYETLATLRPIINPNAGFRRSLEAWWNLYHVLPDLTKYLPKVLLPIRQCLISYLIGNSDYFQVKD
jgi:protein-tyrosine phosphatase